MQCLSGTNPRISTNVKMYNFPALIFIISAFQLVDSQTPYRQRSELDFIPEHRVSGENKLKEACIKVDTGWWGTDVTPKIFNNNRLLIGFPLDQQYISVELKMETVKNGANVCLCYKDKMQKKHRYKPLYKNEIQMHFYCGEDYSMLCYGMQYRFVAGNVAALAAHDDVQWFKNVIPDPVKPKFTLGEIRKIGEHYSLTFEFSIADKVSRDQHVQVAAHLNSKTNLKPFWIPQFERRRVTDAEDGREYDAISVLPFQSMKQRHNKVIWCFKGGRLITEKIDKKPVVGTMDNDQFKALDDFEPFSVVKSDIQELFQFSRGSAHETTWLMICLLFCFYILLN